MAMIPAIPDEGRTIRRYPLASAETPLEGAAVVLATGEVTACGADPASVLGFMAHDAPSSGLAINPYGGDVLVYVAKPGSTFWLSGSSDPTDLSAIGSSYGVAHEATTEVTYVDLTDTSNLVVQVEDVDLSRLLYKVSILEAVRQLHA